MQHSESGGVIVQKPLETATGPVTGGASLSVVSPVKPPPSSHVLVAKLTKSSSASDLRVDEKLLIPNFLTYLEELSSKPEHIDAVYKKLQEFVGNDESALKNIRNFYEEKKGLDSKSTLNAAKRSIFHFAIESVAFASRAPLNGKPRWAVYNHDFQAPARVALELMGHDVVTKKYKPHRVAHVKLCDVLKRSGLKLNFRAKANFPSVVGGSSISCVDMKEADVDIYSCFGEFNDKGNDSGLKHGPLSGDVYNMFITYLKQKEVKKIKLFMLHQDDVFLEESLAKKQSSEALKEYTEAIQLLQLPGVEFVTLDKLFESKDFKEAISELKNVFDNDKEAEDEFIKALVNATAEFLVKQYKKKINNSLIVTVPGSNKGKYYATPKVQAQTEESSRASDSDDSSLNDEFETVDGLAKLAAVGIKAAELNNEKMTEKHFEAVILARQAKARLGVGKSSRSNSPPDKQRDVKQDSPGTATKKPKLSKPAALSPPTRVTAASHAVHFKATPAAAATHKTSGSAKAEPPSAPAASVVVKQHSSTI